jgi:hypothetical protein
LNYWRTGFSKKTRHEDFPLKGTGMLSKTLLHGNLGDDRVRSEVNDSVVRVFKDDGPATFRSMLLCDYLRRINGTGPTLPGREFIHNFSDSEDWMVLF